MTGNNDGRSDRELLFVHGRDFKPDADDFMDLSVAAILTGIERDFPDFVDEFCSLQKRIAYYGDITDNFLTSKGQRYVEALDIGDRRNALINLKGYDRKKHFGVARYDRLPART